MNSGTSPPGWLVALTLAVLLAHLAILRGTPALWEHLPEHPPREPGLSFNTRSISAAPVQAPAAADRAMALRPPAARAQPQPPANTPATPEAAPTGNPSSESSVTAKPVHGSPVAAEADSAPLPSPPAARPPREHLAAASAFVAPPSVHLSYKVETNKFPFSLNSELTWQQDGENYEARLEYHAFGQTRAQTSRGRITAEGLAPLRFSDKYRSEVAAHFVREKGKVTFSANTPDVPLLAGAQDRLSILLQLAAMLAGNPDHFPPAATIAIQTIGPRDADTWLFTVGNRETLSLPGGEQSAVKLVRNARQEFDQKVELWLAPALAYLPVRIRITETNGDLIDQKWLAIDPPLPSGP